MEEMITTSIYSKNEVLENSTEQSQQIIQSNKITEEQNQQSFEYAGFLVRIAAMFVDSLILIIPSIVVGVVFGKNLGFILQYILMWTYAIYMLNTRQATFGKMVVGLKVVTIDGSVLSVGKLALREIIGKTILNSLTLGIGYIMIAFTAKKQGLHDMIAGTIVVYDPKRKRRSWITVVAVGMLLMIPAGILAGVILASLSSAKSKAEDASVKVGISSIVPDTIIYFDQHNDSYLGYEPNSKFKLIECSGEPILNISKDGKSIAIFAKSCSDDKKYFCADEDGSVEVSVDYVNSGASKCVFEVNKTGNEERNINIAVKENLDVTDKNQIGYDASRDLFMINSALEIAKKWQVDSMAYIVFMISDGEPMNEHEIVFKSEKRPGKMFFVRINTSGKIISSGEDINRIGEGEYIRQDRLKFGSAESFKISEDLVKEKIGEKINEYNKNFSLSYIADAKSNVWIYTLTNKKSEDDTINVFIDAFTGEILLNSLEQ